MVSEKSGGSNLTQFLAPFFDDLDVSATVLESPAAGNGKRWLDGCAIGCLGRLAHALAVSGRT